MTNSAASSMTDGEKPSAWKLSKDRRKARNALVRLRERWPNLFGLDPKPLMLGIHTAIEAAMPDMGRRSIRRALKRHSYDRHYLRAVAREGAMRVDLDGNPVEPVAPDHRAKALEALEALEAIDRAHAEWVAARDKKRALLLAEQRENERQAAKVRERVERYAGWQLPAKVSA